MKKLFFLLVALAFAFVANVNAQYSASAENNKMEWLDPNKLSHGADLNKIGNLIFEKSDGTEILVHGFKGKTHYVGFAVSLDGTQVFKYYIDKDLSFTKEKTTEETANVFLKRMASN